MIRDNIKEVRYMTLSRSKSKVTDKVTMTVTRNDKEFKESDYPSIIPHPLTEDNIELNHP